MVRVADISVGRALLLPSEAVTYAAHGGSQGVLRRFESRGRQRSAHKSRDERQAFWNWVWNQACEACSRLEGRLDINIAIPLRLGSTFFYGDISWCVSTSLDTTQRP
jgi:hypothetical protein